MGRIKTIGNEDDYDLEFDLSEKEELVYFGKTKYKDSDYEDDKCDCDYEEPKNKHGVEFNLSVNSKDADAVRKALISAGHIKIADKLEIKRELSIMHEVMGCEGNNVLEKVDNCIEKWRKAGDYLIVESDMREPKYKMKHRVLNATKV